MERTKYNLDTHILVWIYTGQSSRIPHKIYKKMEISDLYISPLVELELQYLYEIGRLRVSPENLLQELNDFFDIEVLDTSFSEIIEAAKKVSWTRDAFDRIIVASSIVEDMPLITADRKILANFSESVWD